MIVGKEELYGRGKGISKSEFKIFDVEKLPRTSDLGSRLNFSDVVEPTEATLLNYINGCVSDCIARLPDNILTVVRDNSEQSL